MSEIPETKLLVYASANGEMVGLQGRVKSVKVSGDTAKCYRTATVDIVNAIHLRESVLTFENGTELRVVYDKVEVFRGILMQHGIDTNANTTLVAHDYNFYLTKNADTVNYKNKTADEILKDLCGKFGIPTGEIDGTQFKLKKFIKSGTVYDLVMEALKETQLQTGKTFRLRNKGGVVELHDTSKVVTSVILRNNIDITSASYNESIEDIQTKVKLTGGDEKNPITVTETSPNASKYGSMQHYEHISDIKKASELKKKATAMVKEMSKSKKSYAVDALGDTSVMSGTSIGAIESMTRLSGTFTVESDNHTFSAWGNHTMSLALTKL